LVVPADGIDGACPGVQVGIGELGDDIDGDFQPVPSLPEQPEDIKDQNYDRGPLPNHDPKVQTLDRDAEKYLSRIGELRSVINVPLVNRVQQPFERSALYDVFPAGSYLPCAFSRAASALVCCCVVSTCRVFDWANVANEPSPNRRAILNALFTVRPPVSSGFASRACGWLRG
jgi:hypothetical protein